MTRTAPPRLDELSPRVAAAAVRRRLDTTDVRTFLSSTPARLLGVGSLLLIGCLLTGLVTASTVSSRQHALQGLLDVSEREAYSAQELYTALSMADAAAATAFISGGLEPAPVRDRYSQAIHSAATELTVQSDNGADDPDGLLRTEIGTRLPVYTGLIETARANNREGHPVGAAYLSEASNLMQNEILPRARELQRHRADAITATQRHHVQPPWAAIVLALLTLLALLAAQLYLARRSRRLLNPGMLSASGTLVILLAWTVIAGAMSAVSTTHSRNDGANPTSQLTESRILAQQARTAETLKLVRRDTGGSYDRAHHDAIETLTARLTEYPSGAPGSGDVEAARGFLDRWQQAHRTMNDALASGDLMRANDAAIGSATTGAAGATAEVDGLEGALRDGIVETRDTLRNRVSEATGSLSLLAPGALALAALAAVFVVAGLWPRLREYR